MGFAEFSTENIPAAGKNVLRMLVPLRATFIADANLVLAEAGDVAVCKELVEGYLGEFNKLGENFEKVLETLDVADPNAELVITEIIKLESKLKGLLKYCKIKNARKIS